MLYVCFFAGFPTESKEVGTVISPFLQKGKLRLRELEEDHRARKWRAGKRVLLFPTSATCFPPERPPNAPESALVHSKVIVSVRTPRNLAHSAPPDPRAPST